MRAKWKLMFVRCYNMIRRGQKAGGVVPQNVTPTSRTESVTCVVRIWAGGPNISIMVHHDPGRVSRPPPWPRAETNILVSLQLCTKYQVKYSCLGPDKSLRLHSVCSSDYIILCAYILDLLVPLPTYIIKIHIRFFHPFPGEKVFNVKENFWRFPLIEIAALL